MVHFTSSSQPRQAYKLVADKRIAPLVSSSRFYPEPDATKTVTSPKIHKIEMLYSDTQHLFPCLGHSGGCVAMRGQHPMGYWEVKSCKNFKAMSLCKQKINSYEEPELTFQKHLSSCYFGWESEANLLNCYKVRDKLALIFSDSTSA